MNKTTYEFISGTFYLRAPLERAVGPAVAHDLFFYGGRVISPWSCLNHALKDAKITVQHLFIYLNSYGQQ